MTESLANPKVLLENRYAKVYQVEEHPQTLICELLVSYVPEASFKEMFAQMAEIIKKAKNAITTFVFDKRALTTFHQASMVWYHLEWKPEMLKYGLKHYRKILPKDTLFQKSVEIGRNKIKQDHPEFIWENYDIQYRDDLEQALEA
jgi:hypothetical protein